MFFTSDVHFLAHKFLSILHAEISFTAHRIKRTVKIWSALVDNEGFLNDLALKVVFCCKFLFLFKIMKIIEI